METYSHSKLRMFEQCPLKYKYRYIDKIIIIEESIESFLGKIVHKVLEWLYQELKRGKTPTIDELIIYYRKKWEEKYNSKINIVRKEFNEKDYFNKGIELLINYYTENKPFNDNTIAIEKKILINLDENKEYKIQGFIDRLVHNLEKNQIEVHDYKTTNSLPAREKIENDRQLSFYSIAVKELFKNDKDKKILLVWHYLAYKKKIFSRRTDEQLQDVKEKTLLLIKQVEAVKKFPAKRSILCDWCEYKSICPIFTGNLKSWLIQN